MNWILNTSIVLKVLLQSNNPVLLLVKHFYNRAMKSQSSRRKITLLVSTFFETSQFQLCLDAIKSQFWWCYNCQPFYKLHPYIVTKIFHYITATWSLHCRVVILNSWIFILNTIRSIQQYLFGYMCVKNCLIIYLVSGYFRRRTCEVLFQLLSKTLDMSGKFLPNCNCWHVKPLSNSRNSAGESVYGMFAYCIKCSCHYATTFIVRIMWVF